MEGLTKETFVTRKPLYVIALSTWFIASAAQADFALGAKAGTLGLGLEATTSLSDYFNVRFGVNGYSTSFDETVDDIRYDADLDLRSGDLILDWHPFAGTFRLSAGVVYNKNEAHVTARPANATVTIGGTTYSSAAAGTVTGDVTFKKTAPYVGFGWGNAVNRGSPFGFNAEIGALFQGKPDVKLQSSSAAVSQADLDREEQELETKLDDLKIYPVISLGFSYRF